MDTVTTATTNRITAEQAVQMLSAQIESSGKFSVGNLFDGIVGVAAANAPEIQALLNTMLTKTGVLSLSDSAQVQALVAQQQAQRKERQRVRLKNGLIIGAVVIGIGTLVYITFKKSKKS